MARQPAAPFSRVDRRPRLSFILDSLFAALLLLLSASVGDATRGQHSLRTLVAAEVELDEPEPQPSILLESSTLSEEFDFLGNGLCLDSFGGTASYGALPSDEGDWSPVTADGYPTSVECSQLCLSKEPCVGYVLLVDQEPAPPAGVAAQERPPARRCALIDDSTFAPAAADGNSKYRCYARHTFKRDSHAYSGQPAPIPKVIWSFWAEPPPKDPWYVQFGQMLQAVGGFSHNQGNTETGLKTSPVPSHENDGGKGGKTIAPFLSLCIQTWRTLNPDYEIRMLDEVSVWKWLQPADLPAGFNRMAMAHKADAIRLALLVKYGGVWLDASLLLLKSIEQMTGKGENITNNVRSVVPPQRIFFTGNPNRQGRGQLGDGATTYVENWFLMAPPEDPLLVQTRKCFNEFFSDIPGKGYFAGATVGNSDLFTWKQSQVYQALGIDSYFAMYACVHKVLDEDVSLHKWWHGDAVLRYSSWDSGFRLFHDGWGFWGLPISPRWFSRFATGADKELLDNLSGSESMVIKFPSAQRSYVAGLSNLQIWCRSSTLRELLWSIGVRKPTHVRCSMADDTGPPESA